MWHIALNTLREAVRQKLCKSLVLLASLVVMGAHLLRDFHFGSPELKFIAELGDGALAGFGAVLTVVATAQFFCGELERRTIQTLLAKPVTRAEFVLGKFAGVALLTGGFCVLLTGLLAAVLWVRENALMQELSIPLAGGRLVNYGHLVTGGMLQWLQLLVLGSFTLLVASYAQSQLFTVTTGFLLWVACHLQPLAQVAAVRAGATVGGMLMGGIARMLPNFQVFGLADVMGASELPPWGQLAQVALYAVAYAVAACGLAAFCFGRREI